MGHRAWLAVRRPAWPAHGRWGGEGDGRNRVGRAERVHKKRVELVGREVGGRGVLPTLALTR